MRIPPCWDGTFVPTGNSSTDGGAGQCPAGQERGRTINKGAENFQDVKKLVEAANAEPDEQAGIRIRRSAKVAMSGHCLMCGACTDSCPQGLQVSDVVRCSDYYLENAEYVEMAFETYRELSRTPSLAACGSCSICEKACGNNVPVLHHIRRAETVLA